ncbi:MAG: hypothetical protein C0592_08135 [Marinilabiliales bacterium]|nr:MAG: hypothetical protein C0592_08135 [Marinilabiliales bacterium]
MRISKGDVVMTLMNSTYQWNFIDTAINRIGAIHLPLYQVNIEFFHAIKNVAIKLIITDNDLQSPNLQEDIPEIRLSDLTNLVADSEIEPDTSHASLLPGDAAYIFYSFDHNSVLRAYVFTNENIINWAKEGSMLLPLETGSKYLSLLPVSKVFERSTQLAHIFLGCSIQYSQAGAFPSKTINESQADSCSIVPSLLRYPFRLNNAEQENKYGKKRSIKYDAIDKKDLREFYGNKIKHLICGGAPIHHQTEDEYFENELPVFNGWGLTQSLGAFTMNTHFANKRGSVGRAIGDNKLDICKTGEILISGPTVSDHCLENKKLKKCDRLGEFIRTGDIGHVDHDGYLHIDGSIREVFKMPNGLFLFTAKHEKDLAQALDCKVLLCRDYEGLLHLQVEKTLNENEIKMLRSLRIVDFAAYTIHSISQNKDISEKRPYFYEYQGDEVFLKR